MLIIFVATFIGIILGNVQAATIKKRDNPNATCPTNQPFYVTTEALNTKYYLGMFYAGHFQAPRSQGLLYFVPKMSEHSNVFAFKENEGGCQLVLASAPYLRAVVKSRDDTFARSHHLFMESDPSGPIPGHTQEFTEVYCHTNEHLRLFCKVSKDGYPIQATLVEDSNSFTIAQAQFNYVLQDFYIEFTSS